MVNLKYDTRLIGAFREEMKAHWLSVTLDGAVDDEKNQISGRYKL